MAELINAYESKINSIKLIPADGGKFEVIVDDKLVYSKLATGRHVEQGELSKLVGEVL
ncbi:MAG: Rdx family protein [Anaerolineales bacterium]|jgi:selenoprotein W-related protein|nr:Rdx family protein [Anaerolineales bacterium]